MKLRLALGACLCVSLLGGATPLQAQIFCEGDACSLLPLSTNDLNAMLYAFKFQYSDELFTDMAEAAALANIAQAPIGSVHLHRFAAGGYAGVGVLEPREIPVYIPGVGVLDPIPAGGVGINPRVFLGVNLGWLMGQGYRPFSGDKRPGPFSPARFDIYINGVEFSENQSAGGLSGFEPQLTTDASGESAEVKFVPTTSQESYNIQAFSRGAELRYHLMEGQGSTVAARWYGLSLGMGYGVSRQEISARQAEQQLGFQVEVEGTDADLIWQGSNFLNWTTRVSTATADVKTGVQFLYFFNITVVAGVAQSNGKSEFLLSRTGPVFLASDLEAVYGIDLPDAFLTLVLTGEGRPRSTTPYGKLGLGFNLGPLKIQAELLYTDRARETGGTIGAHIQF